MALLAGGCSRGAKTPAEAHKRLSDAVAARNGERLFDALDLETRWSWMSIQRARREAHDITLSNFPEGADRERQLKRFESAALSESAAQLFARELRDGTWTELQAGVGGTLRVTGDRTAEVVRDGGKPLPFRKDDQGKWGWGYAGLAEEAEQLKRRAIADLEVIRASAADYERAAVRQGR